MKTENWLCLDHHEFVCVDLLDGRRIELRKGDKLLLAVDSITIKEKGGIDYIIPCIQIAQILKKYKERYL